MSWCDYKSRTLLIIARSWLEDYHRASVSSLTVDVMKVSIRTSLLIVTALVVGCGPVRMYSGEPRARSEVAYISFNTLGADIVGVQVDGKRVTQPGMTV